jgi:hypothetical protein
MERSEARIDDDAIPARLAAPVSVAVSLCVPIEEAVKRLSQAVERAASVESDRGSTDRRLVGEVSATVVRLSVVDSHWARGPRGWKVEFLGHLESGPGLGALRGVVEIVDTNHVRRLLWVFRVAALVPLLFAIASASLQPNLGPPQGGALLFALAIAVFTFLAIPLAEASVERAAAADAKVLTSYFRRQLG